MCSLDMVKGYHVVPGRLYFSSSSYLASSLTVPPTGYFVASTSFGGPRKATGLPAVELVHRVSKRGLCPFCWCFIKQLSCFAELLLTTDLCQ